MARTEFQTARANAGLLEDVAQRLQRFRGWTWQKQPELPVPALLEQADDAGGISPGIAALRSIPSTDP